jgi:hypothetical protein
MPIRRDTFSLIPGGILLANLVDATPATAQATGAPPSQDLAKRTIQRRVSFLTALASRSEMPR